MALRHAALMPDQEMRTISVPGLVYDRVVLNLNWFVAPVSEGLHEMLTPPETASDPMTSLCCLGYRQTLTAFLYICLAAWPFFPILLQWRWECSCITSDAKPASFLTSR